MRRGIIALCTLVLVALTACGGPTSSGPGSDLVEGERGLTRVPVGDREPAPVASGEDLDGEPLSTEDFPGKVIVLNVWGSWCPGCRLEAPALVAAQEQTAEIAQFIGINTRDPDPAQAKAFERAFEINYPSIYDPAGAELLKFTDLPPGAIPSTLIIDPDGRVAARVIGETTTATLVGMIEDIAEGK